MLLSRPPPKTMESSPLQQHRVTGGPTALCGVGGAGPPGHGGTAQVTHGVDASSLLFSYREFEGS